MPACVVCGADISSSPRFCKTCDNYQGPPCGNCGAPLVSSCAEKCTTCDSYQAKPCKRCGAALISNRSAKCTVCGEYQNRWAWILNFLGVSSVISVVPLLVVFGTYVLSISERKHSSVDVAPLQCSATGVDFFARNTGNSPAALTATAYYVTENNPNQKMVLNYARPLDSQLMLAGGSGQLFKLKPPSIAGTPGQISVLSNNNQDCGATIWYGVVEFGRSPEMKSFECKC